MRSWTHAEEEALRYLAPRLSGPELAVAFGRSHLAIRSKACRLRIRLGRARATNLQQQTPAVLRRVSQIMDAELCPSCGRRAIGVKSTGLCGPCHYDRLREVHEEEIARLAGQRGLWAARSKLRRRRASAASTPEPQKSR